MMLVQEPVQAAIWHCLNHYAFQDATFLAERLCSEVETDETIFLLATCYYRSGQVHQAHWLLSSKKINSPPCRFLLAKCAFELNEFYSAEMSLTLDHPLKGHSLDGVSREFGEIACFALQLLARICSKSERQSLASKAHRYALKLNPFLWHSFTDLCHLRQTQADEPVVDPEQVFQFTNDTFRTCQSQSSFLGVREATAGVSIDAMMAPPAQQQQQQQVNQSTIYSPSTLTTPVDQIINSQTQNFQLRAIPFDATTPNSNSLGPSGFITPQENVLSSANNANLLLKAAAVVAAPPATGKKQFRLMSNFSPLTPSFGVMPLASPLSGTPAATAAATTTMMLMQTPQQQQQNQNLSNDQNEQPVVVAKKIRSHNSNATTNSNIKRKDSPLPESKFLLNQVNNMTNVRRSSRLFSSNNQNNHNNNSYSATTKENTNNSRQAEQANNLLNKAPKSPMRKSKQRITSNKLNATTVVAATAAAAAATVKTYNALNSSLGELNEKANAKGALIEDQVSQQIIMAQQQQQNCSATFDVNQILNLKRESVEGLMTLLRQMGKACLALDRFNCREALDLFRALPPQHLASSWVQSQIGLAHHEVHEYEAAARIFKEVHRREPHRLHLMEIYSTALWHLQREVELSALAHDLMAQDKSSPVTWCVTGNCFSLHKEHDVAIKFFQRAVQVDAEFVYSYILLGHEFVITEELEKAMSCFRTAITKEVRHYNAWFGIGTIYSKQEKFAQAELHYAHALRINPRNSVILVHIGAMQLFGKRMEQALATLNAAIRLDPKNPLGKFHRSRLFFATKRYEEALAELEELKEIVPKESVIYYLIGKIHTKMGNCDLGLMHFSWASELDPKGANNQIKESFDSAAAMAGSGVNTSGGGGGGVSGEQRTGGEGSGSGGGLADNTVNSSNGNNSSNLPYVEDDDEEGIEIADEDVTGEHEVEEDEEGDEEDEEIEEDDSVVAAAVSSSRSFQTPARRRNSSSGRVMAVAGAPGRPAAGGVTAATTGVAVGEVTTGGMETPRMWNPLNYDSDSF